MHFEEANRRRRSGQISRSFNLSRFTALLLSTLRTTRKSMRILMVKRQSGRKGSGVLKLCHLNFMTGLGEFEKKCTQIVCCEGTLSR